MKNIKKPKPLTTKEYNSPFLWRPQEYIKELVDAESFVWWGRGDILDEMPPIPQYKEEKVKWSVAVRHAFGSGINMIIGV